ncbi:MAG: hypothetical protein V3R37_06235 [Rhodospirillales bacterium]
MFARFREYLKNRDIHQINKAAPEIIDYSRQCLKPETVRHAALLTAEHLERVKKIYGDDPLGSNRALVEYKGFHNDSKRKRDDAALTAFTLVMIYIRATDQGAPCNAAMKSIDDWTGEWAHGSEN